MKTNTVLALALLSLTLAADAQQSTGGAAGKSSNVAPLVGNIVSYSGPMFFPSDPLKRKAYQASWLLTQKALKLSSQKDWTAAIPIYEQALTVYPDSPSAYSGLAQAYMRLGQTDDAIATLRRLYYGWPGRDWSSDVECWGKTPDEYTYMLNLEKDAALLMQFALLLEQTNQGKEALRVYQRGFQFLPADRGPLPPAPDTLGLTGVHLEAATRTGLAIVESDKDDALSQLRLAVVLQPDLAAAYYNQGEILKHQDGRSAEAITAFNKAAQLGGSEMKPFVDKAMKDGSSEFTAAVKETGKATQ